MHVHARAPSVAHARRQEADMQKLRTHGVHAVFMPTTLYESGA